GMVAGQRVDRTARRELWPQDDSGGACVGETGLVLGVCEKAQLARFTWFQATDAVHDRRSVTAQLQAETCGQFTEGCLHSGAGATLATACRPWRASPRAPCR